MLGDRYSIGCPALLWKNDCLEVNQTPHLHPGSLGGPSLLRAEEMWSSHLPSSERGRLLDFYLRYSFLGQSVKVKRGYLIKERQKLLDLIKELVLDNQDEFPGRGLDDDPCPMTYPRARPTKMSKYFLPFHRALPVLRIQAATLGGPQSTHVSGPVPQVWVLVYD